MEMTHCMNDGDFQGITLPEPVGSAVRKALNDSFIDRTDENRRECEKCGIIVENADYGYCTGFVCGECRKA